MASWESGSWQSGRTALECHAHMFDQSLLTDVTLVVSNTASIKNQKPHKEEEQAQSVTIKAHKYVLVSRSPVFMSMFYGSMADTRAEVPIDDVDPHTFHNVVRYMYTDCIDLEANNVMYVWYIAKKYMLNTLTTKCSDFLKGYLSPENAATLLDQGLFFEDSDLVTMCLRQIRRNPSHVLSSQCFTEISQGTLDRILDLETMNIKEVYIFKACQKWAEYTCRENDLEVTGPNMRSMLGSSLNKVRFPLIPVDVFTKEVAETNILSEADELKLFRFMCSGEETKKEVLPYPNGERIRLGQTIKLHSEMEGSEIMETHGTFGHSLELEISDDITVEGLYIYDPLLFSNDDRQHIPNLTISAQLNGRSIGQIIGYMETIENNPNIKRFSWNYGRLPMGVYTMTVHYWISLCSHCGSQNPYTKRNFSYCDQKGCRNNLSYQGTVCGYKADSVELDDGLVSVKIRNKKALFMPVVGLLYSL